MAKASSTKLQVNNWHHGSKFIYFSVQILFINVQAV